MPVSLKQSAGRIRSNHCIHVGLINNMGDEALKSTERQYTSLLRLASGSMQIHLSFYTLPEIPRSDAGARHIAAHYSSIDDLWEGELDGLIVTGREPLAAKLMDEPYWHSFTKTLLWAQENAHSTVWSCLAAHAAVLYLDGINRAKRDDKLFGIFRCNRSLDHPLIAGTPSCLHLPHSRWNGLPEEHLAAGGYSVLTRTGDAEVDTFIKQQKKLFVFFQGHPEYDADTLLREYRRDIGRYLKGERPQYPSMPQGYFDRDTEEMLEALQRQTGSGRDDQLLPAISAALGDITIESTWQASAVGIYENWLRHIRAQQNSKMRSKSSQSIVNTPLVGSAGVAL